MLKKSAWMTALTLAIALPFGALAMQDDKGESKDKESKEIKVQAAIGKPAPEFTLKDSNGKEYKLSQFKGKIVVLQWTDNNCPFIKYHEGKAETMQATCEQFEEKGVVWLAINSASYCEEKAKEINEWIKEHTIPYPVLLDASGTVGHTYGAKTTPHMFVIDREGILQYQGAIDDDPSMDGDGTRNYVEDAVNALLQGSAVAQKETKSYGCSIKYKN
jgi:peroxiredoxin